jgi:hypothetical protein
MNERIKELIMQAVKFRLDPDSECYEAQVCPEDLEYLAELIVDECAGVGSNIVLTETEDNDMGVFLGIKQHFGVEE